MFSNSILLNGYFWQTEWNRAPKWKKREDLTISTILKLDSKFFKNLETIYRIEKHQIAPDVSVDNPRVIFSVMIGNSCNDNSFLFSVFMEIWEFFSLKFAKKSKLKTVRLHSKGRKESGSWKLLKSFFRSDFPNSAFLLILSMYRLNSKLYGTFECSFDSIENSDSIFFKPKPSKRW